MNFAQIKSVAIPEGMVSKISSGNTVLWSVGSGLPPVGTALNNFTWEQIRQISDAGEAAKYFSVGDTKSIILNGQIDDAVYTDISLDAVIMGIDHNADLEGYNRIHFGIGGLNGELIALVDQTNNDNGFMMNTTNTNSGGWANSYMRTTILGSNGDPINPAANTFLAALEPDLRAVMKSVTKYTNNTGNNNGEAAITPTIDFLALLSEFEMRNSRYMANIYEQQYQKYYDYFASYSSTLYKHSDPTSYASAWTRSSTYNNAQYFVTHTSAGNYYGNATGNYAIFMLFFV